MIDVGAAGADAAALHEPRISLAAPAKVNLYLHVLGRRADGMHLLDSLIVFAGCGDTVHAAAAQSLTLTIDGPFGAGLACDDSNLVLRAAVQLAAAADQRGWRRRVPGAALRLTKRLPVASGIGGGSTDAAAALLALTSLWELPADRPLLQTIGLSIGADVPVCLERAARFVGGIGEQLDPVPALPPAWLVLVNPGVVVATASVFRTRAPVYSQPARWSEPVGSAAELARRLAARSNDLAPAAVAVAPQIETVLAALSAQPGCLLARLSGSGATCFGVFASPQEAEAAASAVARAQPQWWTRACQLLQRADEIEVACRAAVHDE